MQIAASILSADFCHLAELIERLEKAGVDYLHIDVMDGHFVPNISFGLPVVRSIAETTSLPLDVHLMVSHPERYVDQFAQFCHMMSFHFETEPHIHRRIWHIKNLGIKAGIALNPATRVNLITDVAQDVDFLLLMSVNPGFGGQKFIRHTEKKLSEASQLGPSIEVDGGINDSTIRFVKDAQIVVVGSWLVKRADIAEGVAILRQSVGV